MDYCHSLTDIPANYAICEKYLMFSCNLSHTEQFGLVKQSQFTSGREELKRMMNSIFKKSSWMVLLPAGILLSLLAASSLFAAYSGHVASFKSEDNAVTFVSKMKAKGLVAFYRKEDVPGKGELYRSYIGRYETLPLARKALTKLKKAGEIDYFQIKQMTEKKGEIATMEMETGAQKNESAQKPENKTAPSIDTQRYYEGIKGIVLNNGKIIKGQIISIDDNDVLKIRTKGGKILSYSFMKEVKEYITE